MRRIVVPTLALLAFGCTTPNKTSTHTTPPKVVKVAIGGSVSGLTGHGLVLQNAGGDALTLSDNGSFTFATTVATGSTYAVTVATQPSAPTQACVVAHGSGTATQAVTDITVTCTTSTYHVGGSVVGLQGSGLVLRDNGGDDLTITASGTFAFATPVASAQSYGVTIATQPTAPAQTCSVAGGSGVVGGADVTSVVVNCTTNHVVSGTVVGLAGTGLVLQDNGGDDLAVASSSFAFATPLAKGAAYAVTVKTQPSAPTQTCTVAQAAGTIDASDVSNVVVTCTTNVYTVGGSVSGLVGSGLVLANGTTENLPVGHNGSFTFVTAMASGSYYGVTVATQPSSPSQTCTVDPSSAQIGAANVTNIAVTCVTNAYKVGGTVSGLGGHGLVLQDNGGDDLSVSGDGSFTFATSVDSGGDFAVTVATQPDAPAQNCSVSGATGTVGGSDVTSVVVSCSNRYTIGGTIAGLGAHGLAVALNGGDSVVLSANGTWALPTTLADGAAYAVTVVAQPNAPAQTCTINNASGNVAAANVVNVQITCDDTPFRVGGTVSGLVGSGLVLEDDGGDDLAVGGNGNFAFATWVYGPYAVTVATQPSSPAQTCVVANGAGSISTGAVSNVAVTCTTNTYAVSGTITGLSGTVVLEDNGNDVLTLSGASSFTFGSKVASGGSYAVTVAAQPSSPEQTCTVTSGAGPVVAADITNVAIDCVANPYKVNVHVSGLTGSGLVLQDNGGDDLAVAGNGAYAFATAIVSGGAYAVTVWQQPGAQVCTVAGGSGTIGSGDVDTVVVNCDSNAFVVGGTVSGLGGHGLVLQDNGGDDLAVNANGSFNFATTVGNGGSYAVSVKTQPTNAWQTCTVGNGSGTVSGADVSSVTVTCAATPYHVNVSVSGVAGGGLVLADNGGDNLSVSSDGSYTFATPVASGSAYAVSVLVEPTSPWQTCSVTSGSGVVAGSDVAVSVACSTDTHTIGGTVVALDAAGLKIQDNGGNDLTLSASGNFVFTSPVTSGGAYAVTIAQQPTGQYCLVRHGAGTVAGSDVTSVIVTCQHLTNGSFETGDYSAWTISVVHINDSAEGTDQDYDYGTWALLASGTTVAFESTLYDQFTHTDIVEYNDTNTYYASNGNYVAVGLENGAEDHRLYQDVIVPLDATNLCWDVAYNNENFVNGTFDDGQYIAVNLRDVDTDAIIATLYKTTEGVDPESISTMTTFRQDISAYRGRLVRIDFEIYATEGYLATALDNINFE